MYLIKPLVVFTIIVLCVPVRAQNKDSLWKAFNNKALADTLRFDACNDLRIACDETNPDSALIIAQKLFEFSKNMKDENCKALAIFSLGYENFATGKYRNAISYYTDALAKYEKINRKRGIANCHSNTALAYLRLGEFESAFKKYRQALDLYVELKDTSMQGRTYNQLALVRDYQGHWLESLDLYYHALKLFEELHDKYGQSVILINIATIYNEMKDEQKGKEMLDKALALKKEVGDEFGQAIVLAIFAERLTDTGQLDEALENHNKALAIYEKYEAKEKIGLAYCAIARVYKHKKQYAKALEFYQKGIALEKNLELNTELGISLSHLGQLYIELGRITEGIASCNEGLSISSSTGNLDAKRQNCQCLSLAYEKKGDAVAALKYYKEYMAIRDSLINDENSKEATRKEMNFTFAKKQLKDSLEYLQQKKIKDLQLSEQATIIKSERMQKVGLYIGLSLLLVLGIVSYRSYRIKKKDNLVIIRQKHEVEMQKQLIETQKHLVEEKQKEIIDSIKYAQRIQHSLMPTHTYIDKMLKNLGEKKGNT
jgi:tetratricopeptide (TPR) repeat protein